MNFNFFTWIREGVKHSVLLGVSDAVTNLGTPRENDDVQHKLMSFLQLPSEGTVNPAPRVGHTPSRKKLGRTLEQIQAGAARTA
jgi:hypothetical protein